MSEYLSHFGKDTMNFPGWQENLETGEAFDRKLLVNLLTSAKEYLTSEPGPHLAERREYSYDWLKWWAEYLKNKRVDQRPALLLPIKQIRRYKDLNIKTGVLFAGGMEGHRGHRRAVDWMLRLLSQDFFSSKTSTSP